MSEEDQVIEMSGEESAGWAAIEGLAVAPENTAQAAAQEQEEAQAATQTDSNAQTIMMIIDLAKPVFKSDFIGFPSVAKVLDDENAQKLAGVWAVVLTKYDIRLGDVAGRWREEIAAVVISYPIAAAIYKAIKHDTAKSLKKQPKAQAAEAVKTAQGAAQEPERLG